MSQQLNWGFMIAAQTRCVPYWLGSPGGGKTVNQRWMAEKLGRRLIEMIARQKMPEDFGGIPTPGTIKVNGQDIRCTEALLCEEMVRAKHERVWLFLDEFPHAGPDVLGAMQQWICDIPENAIITAAGNPIEQSTSGQELPPPVVNRLVFFDYKRNDDVLRAGFRSGGIKWPEAEFPLVDWDGLVKEAEEGEGQLVYWGSLVADFLDQYPNQSGDDAYPKGTFTGEPYPSDRAWHAVIRMMAGCDDVGAHSGTRQDCIRGAVGKGACGTFWEWVRQQGLCDPDEILENPASLNLPARFDYARAILSMVLGRVKAERNNGNGVSYFEQAVDVMGVAFDQHQELAQAAFNKLSSLCPNGYMPIVKGGNVELMRKDRFEEVAG